MTATLLFITHPEVVIDAETPVTEWSLTEVGAERMRAFVARGALGRVGAVYCSAERKARDAAEIAAAHLRLTASVVPELGENDRSSTGYLPKERFEIAADRFFAQPEESYLGWETARAAQRRIVSAVERILREAPAVADIAIVSHGAVGTLYKCHLKAVPITRDEDQPAQGCFYRVDRTSQVLLHDWQRL